MTADLLGDMLVNELLEETAGELGDFDQEERAEDVARAMQQAPNVEALLDRLAQMEVY